MGLSFLNHDDHDSILALIERAPHSQGCFTSIDDYVCFAVDEYSECEEYYEQAGRLGSEQFAVLFKELAASLAVRSPIS